MTAPEYEAAVPCLPPVERTIDSRLHRMAPQARGLPGIVVGKENFSEIQNRVAVKPAITLLFNPYSQTINDTLTLIDETAKVVGGLKHDCGGCYA